MRVDKILHAIIVSGQPLIFGTLRKITHCGVHCLSKPTLLLVDVVVSSIPANSKINRQLSVVLF